MVLVLASSDVNAFSIRLHKHIDSESGFARGGRNSGVIIFISFVCQKRKCKRLVSLPSLKTHSLVLISFILLDDVNVTITYATVLTYKNAESPAI